MAREAHDRDAPDESPEDEGVELIAPHKLAKVMRDGSALRRYKRRWKVERTIARIQIFHHLRVRFE